MNSANNEQPWAVWFTFGILTGAAASAFFPPLWVGGVAFGIWLLVYVFYIGRVSGR